MQEQTCMLQPAVHHSLTADIAPVLEHFRALLYWLLCADVCWEEFRWDLLYLARNTKITRAAQANRNKIPRHTRPKASPTRILSCCCNIWNYIVPVRCLLCSSSTAPREHAIVSVGLHYERQKKWDGVCEASEFTTDIVLSHLVIGTERNERKGLC